MSGHRAARGQVLTAGGWLDLHFEACRAEYEEMLRLAGMKPGWRVLDAGCGAGAFLPLLQDQVGAGGSVVGVDASEDNAAEARERSAARVEVGSVTSLPFDDAAFDAVWCANVLQYVGEDDAVRALAEFARVTRRGGVVAVKDVDMSMMRVFPGSPFLVTHLADATARRPDAVQSRGSLRGRELRRRLEHAGLVDVIQRTFVIERWAPLTPVENGLFREWLAFLAGVAAEAGMPDEDLREWERYADAGAAEHPVEDPRFYVCEGQAVAVGRVSG